MRGSWLLAVMVGAWIGAAAGSPARTAERSPGPRASLDRAPPVSVTERDAAPARGPARRAVARPSARGAAALAAQPSRGPGHGRAGAAPVPAAALLGAPRLVAVRAASGAGDEPARAAGRTLAGGGSAPRAPPRALT